MRKIAMVELLLAGAIFSGCAALGSQGGSSGASGIAESAATSAAPGPSLFNFVGRSTKFVFVSPSALLADSGDVEKSLVQEQCMFHSADPPFLVPTFNQKWLFVGDMNQGPDDSGARIQIHFHLGAERSPTTQLLAGKPGLAE
jgi:hypothetical protein